MTLTLLAGSSITAGYGDLVAIKDVSVDLGEGNLLGVVGPNGAGKSTLLRALAGVIPVRAGTVSWEGRDINALSADKRARLGISMVQEGRRLFPSLSVQENLMLGAYHASPAERQERRDQVVEMFPPLGPIMDRSASVLSGGEQQMVAVGRAWMSKPRCLLIDEPSLGLAPIIVDEIYKALPVLQSAGVSIVLVEQEVGRVLRIADRIVVLHEGTVMHDGPAEDFRDRPDALREAYLGIAPGGKG
ncbi:MAG: ATP-binding cassette domain-containing protein [Propionibacteriales bacterium]|nr:ATP-binding cassette domain-containing protein [Propionibacteriales bacterium]